MAIETRISPEVYEKLALSDPDRKWELRDGQLREKSTGTAAHNWLITKLSFLLLSQLDRSVYQTRTGSSRVRYLDATYVIPDLFAVPVALVAPLLRQDDVLEVYRDPLPLVVEVWSLFAGDFDIEEKLEIHKRRGDAEIWFIHPYNRTVTVWAQQADGSYVELLHGEGTLQPVALPDVVIDLDTLFEG